MTDGQNGYNKNQLDNALTSYLKLGATILESGTDIDSIKEEGLFRRSWGVSLVNMPSQITESYEFFLLNMRTNFNSNHGKFQIQYIIQRTTNIVLVRVRDNISDGSWRKLATETDISNLYKTQTAYLEVGNGGVVSLGLSIDNKIVSIHCTDSTVICLPLRSNTFGYWVIKVLDSGMQPIASGTKLTFSYTYI